MSASQSNYAPSTLYLQYMDVWSERARDARLERARDARLKAARAERLEAARDFYTFDIPFAEEVILFGAQPTYGRGDQTRYIFECPKGAALPEPRTAETIQQPAASLSSAAALPDPPNADSVDAFVFPFAEEVEIAGWGWPNSPQETGITLEGGITSNGSLYDFGGSIEGPTHADRSERSDSGGLEMNTFHLQRPTEAAVPDSRTAEMVQSEQEAGTAVQASAAEAEEEQRRRDDDLVLAVVQGGVFSGCAPEHKAALSRMMKQHAEQVSSLRAENRKLGAKIERQADLLSATIQASEDERRGDTTRFNDEKRRFDAEREHLQAEQGLHISEISRLQFENEDIRASVGPLASLSDSSKQALGSISGLDAVLKECPICIELLLSGIGRPSFGVTSYSCACSRAGSCHVRTLHVNCVVSLADLKCPYCSEEIVVIAPSLMAETLVRRITVRKT